MLSKDEIMSYIDNSGSRLRFLCYGGSIAYGLATPESDTDVRGFIAETRETLLTSLSTTATNLIPSDTIATEELDCEIYNFNKFFYLLYKGSPNCIELLGLHPDSIIFNSYDYCWLVKHSDLFITKQLYKTFKGYANTQLSRPVNNVDEELAFKKLNKQAMHAVRVLMTLRDILDKGKILTWRGKDRDLLLSIRQGKYWTEDNELNSEYWDMVAELKNEVERLYITSDLPDKPDVERLKKLQMYINIKAL